MDAKELTRRVVHAVQGVTGWKQPEVARHIGVTPRQLERWMRPGESSLMPTDVLASILHGEAGLPEPAREAALRVVAGG